VLARRLDLPGNAGVWLILTANRLAEVFDLVPTLRFFLGLIFGLHQPIPAGRFVFLV
jgi:hypothetical protein